MSDDYKEEQKTVQAIPEHVLDSMEEAVQRKESLLEETVYHFYRIAGGPRGMAELMLEQIRHGSAVTKTRIADIVLRYLKVIDAKTSSDQDLGTLTNEDLRNEAAKLIGEIDTVNRDNSDPEGSRAFPEAA